MGRFENAAHYFGGYLVERNTPEIEVVSGNGSTFSTNSAKSDDDAIATRLQPAANNAAQRASRKAGQRQSI